MSICWITVLKMNKNDVSGLVLFVCYMSLGELEKKQQNTKNPKTTLPPRFPTKPKEYFTQEQAALYQTYLQNLTLTHSVLLP